MKFSKIAFSPFPCLEEREKKDRAAATSHIKPKIIKGLKSLEYFIFVGKSGGENKKNLKSSDPANGLFGKLIGGGLRRQMFFGK